MGACNGKEVSVHAVAVNDAIISVNVSVHQVTWPLTCSSTISVSPLNRASQVEFRMLLDFQTAREHFFEYARACAPDMVSCLHGLIYMQTYINMSYSSERMDFAASIHEKYIVASAIVSTAEQSILARHLTFPALLPGDVFVTAQLELFGTLHSNLFTPFKLSPGYQKLETSLRDGVPGSHVEGGDFDYLDVLGEGGFGMVCSVRKKSTGALYAMKLQRKETMFCQEQGRADFEKTVLSGCQHPFIVELFFAFQTKSLAILVMTLGTGMDLSRVLKRGGPLSLSHVLFYSAEITSAVGYLHLKGLAHRDLKPGNVLLIADGHVQLVDFGAVCDLKGPDRGADADADAGAGAQLSSAPCLHQSEPRRDQDGDSSPVSGRVPVTTATCARPNIPQSVGTLVPRPELSQQVSPGWRTQN
jgi:hypothetical protein